MTALPVPVVGKRVRYALAFEGQYITDYTLDRRTADPLNALLLSKGEADSTARMWVSRDFAVTAERVDVDLVAVTGGVRAALLWRLDAAEARDIFSLRVHCLRKALDQEWNARDEDGRDFREALRDVKACLDQALAHDDRMACGDALAEVIE